MSEKDSAYSTMDGRRKAPEDPAAKHSARAANASWLTQSIADSCGLL